MPTRAPRSRVDELWPRRFALLFWSIYNVVGASLVIVVVFIGGLGSPPTGALVFLTFCAVLTYRCMTVDVTAHSDVLTVRNRWRTHHVNRSSIRRVRAAPLLSSGPGPYVISVEIAGRGRRVRVPLHASVSITGSQKRSIAASLKRWAPRSEWNAVLPGRE